MKILLKGQQGGTLPGGGLTVTVNGNGDAFSVKCTNISLVECILPNNQLFLEETIVTIPLGQTGAKDAFVGDSSHPDVDSSYVDVDLTLMTILLSQRGDTLPGGGLISIIIDNNGMHCYTATSNPRTITLNITETDFNSFATSAGIFHIDVEVTASTISTDSLPNCVADT